MYPSLLMLYPEIARSLLLYRFQRMDAARVNAKNHSVSGKFCGGISIMSGRHLSSFISSIRTHCYELDRCADARAPPATL